MKFSTSTQKYASNLKWKDKPDSPFSEKSCIKMKSTSHKPMWLSSTHFTVFRNQWNHQSYFCHTERSLFVLFYHFSPKKWHWIASRPFWYGNYTLFTKICSRRVSKTIPSKERFSRDKLKQTNTRRRLSVSYDPTGKPKFICLNWNIDTFASHSCCWGTKHCSKPEWKIPASPMRKYVHADSISVDEAFPTGLCLFICSSQPWDSL